MTVADVRFHVKFLTPTRPVLAADAKEAMETVIQRPSIDQETFQYGPGTWHIRRQKLRFGRQSFVILHVEESLTVDMWDRLVLGRTVGRDTGLPEASTT